MVNVAIASRAIASIAIASIAIGSVAITSQSDEQPLGRHMPHKPLASVRLTTHPASRVRVEQPSGVDEVAHAEVEDDEREDRWAHGSVHDAHRSR